MKLQMRNMPVFMMIVAITALQSCSHEIVAPLQTNFIDTTTNGGGNNTGGGGGTVNNNPCDPNKVYFVNDVLPILLSSCAYTGCHDASTAKDGVILDNYANVMRTGEVIPGNAWSSELYEAITETDPEDIMPPAPKPHLLPEQVTLIAKWINEGALNNECNDGNSCDTLNVKYSTHIEPIVNTYCKGCHSGTNPSGSILLDNYTNVKITVTNGSFLGSIKRETGWVAMPKNSAKLTDCSIRKIELWIKDGALNN